jgi:hypothetical protein
VLNESIPIVALPPLYERKKRAAKVLASPRVIAAKLGKTDRDTLALVVKNEDPVSGCTLRAGSKHEKSRRRDSMMKRLDKDRSTVFRSLRVLEALGLIGAAKGARCDGSETTMHRFVNQQLLRDVGADDLVWDEALRDRELDVRFQPLPAVSEILASKKALGPRRGGRTFRSDLAEGATPGATPVRPRRTTNVVAEPSTKAKENLLPEAEETAAPIRHALSKTLRGEEPQGSTPIAITDASSRDLESLEGGANPRDDHVARVDLPPPYDPLRALIAGMYADADEAATGVPKCPKPPATRGGEYPHVVNLKGWNP